jgi:hypothetical protein
MTETKPEIGTVAWLKDIIKNIDDNAVIFIAKQEKSGKLDLTELLPITNISSEKIDDSAFLTIHCGDK